MKRISRRQVLKLAGSATAIVPLAMLTSRQAFSSDMPQVDPEAGTAKALGYIHASANPDQLCKNCQLYSGKEGEEWGPCAIFPGSSVAAEGWCKSWIKKAG